MMLAVFAGMMNNLKRYTYSQEMGWQEVADESQAAQENLDYQDAPYQAYTFGVDPENLAVQENKPNNVYTIVDSKWQLVQPGTLTDEDIATKLLMITGLTEEQVNQDYEQLSEVFEQP